MGCEWLLRVIGECNGLRVVVPCHATADGSEVEISREKCSKCSEVEISREKWSEVEISRIKVLRSRDF